VALLGAIWESDEPLNILENAGRTSFVISIAGFDPSGGAGLLSDIKTLEQVKVMGLGVCTALTLQTDSQF
jgi:hypothetical protein